MFYDLFSTPAGEMIVVQDSLGVHCIDFQSGSNPLKIQTDWEKNASVCQETKHQVLKYFSGDLTTFDLPLAPEGTSFQKRVWRALATIPFGETRTYGEIALQLGKPTASRAVGMANGRNPLSIVYPCHRVVGSSRKLTGYRGGLAIKEKLLKHEGIQIKEGLITHTNANV